MPSSSSAKDSHKPFKPVSFDEIDYNDVTQVNAAQDSAIKEQWLRAYALRALRESLGECYKNQTVNHQENCKELIEKYLDMLPQSRVTGYLGPKRNDPSK